MDIYLNKVFSRSKGHYIYYILYLISKLYSKRLKKNQPVGKKLKVCRIDTNQYNN